VKKRQAFRRNKGGVEAESSASRGRKVSVAIDSETGRFRRQSKARGEKNSLLRHNKFVSRHSYLVKKRRDSFP